MSNRHQELASLEQTASSKDFSNLLMADSLAKTISSSNSPCSPEKELHPKQTTLWKRILKSSIVDSLLKTIWLSMHHVVTMKHWLFQSKWLLVFKKLKLKKHEVSLDLSRLATTLNRLERSIQTGIDIVQPNLQST
ncbi:hypothetical protein Tco_1135485 [Tanacetum coccineum]